MTNDVLPTLTNPRTASPRKVAECLFSGLFPEDFPQLAGARLGSDGVKRLAARVYVSEPQRIALWGYLYCATKIQEIEPDTLELANDMMDALAVLPNHEEIARAKIDAILREIEPIPDPEALLKMPPAKLVATITEVAIESFINVTGNPKVLINLQASEFEHERDRSSLNFIRHIPDDVIAKATDIIKRGVEIDVLSSGLLVTADSMPWMHRCYLEAGNILDMRSLPPLYLKTGGMRAYTVGIEEPIVVIESMAASLMDRCETVFLLGRELGHIMAEHTKGRSIAETILGIVGGTLGTLVTSGLSLKLYSWLRYAEFTADRAGYLACQNQEAALRVLMKLAGYPARHYKEMRTHSMVEQAEAFHQRLSESALDRMYSSLGTIGSESNAVIVRAKHLLDWVYEGHPERIIARRA